MSSKKESSDKPETDAERASKASRLGTVGYTKTELMSEGRLHRHARKTHRLKTARYTVWGGGVCIVFFAIVIVISHVFSDDAECKLLDYGSDLIIASFSIISIALGFIAGSSVE